MRHERLRDAQRSANALQHRFGARAPHHPHVEAFAARLGVEILVAPLDGATAQLDLLFVPNKAPPRSDRRWAASA
jgi:hypothetical protein